MMLVPLHGQRVGRLHIAILRDFKNSTAYIELAGMLPLGEETAMLSRHFGITVRNSGP